VIFLFDPHGAGSLPLQKYKALADAYGFILVGSNNSKNGNDWSTTEHIWQCLWADLPHRLSINKNRVYTVGFSGGAKVASYIALHHTGIQGVVVTGAALPDETPDSDFPFSITILAGEGDLNLTDLVATNAALNATHTRHSIVFFNGKHEWAPVSAMRIAFTGLQLDAMRKHLLVLQQPFIDQYIAESKRIVESSIQANQLYKAMQQCTCAASLLDGLPGNGNLFKQQCVAIASNTLYKKQWQAEQQLLYIEQQTKEEYQQHFQQENKPYWVATIDHLKASATGNTDEAHKNQRLLAYLSLAFYSISNQLISTYQNSMARYFTDLYILADPSNSEAWYFSAILRARAQDTAGAEHDLLQAVSHGFMDIPRMRHQSEFQAAISLTKVEAAMHHS